MFVDFNYTPSPRYQRLFRHYNRKYFENSLPDILVGTDKLLKITKIPTKILENATPSERKLLDGGKYGLACWDVGGKFYIILDKSITIFHRNMARITLIHELAHFKVGLHLGHGKKFKAEIRRLAALGAFDDLI